MRYFIEFSYNGTAYNGWQRQNNALGVQQVLEEAVSKLVRKPVEITGSSRTDAGVHAEQQFAHFDCEEIQRPDLFVYSVNGMIPFDVAVKRIFPVDETLHSRFAATHRSYEYRIAKLKNPFLVNQVHVLRAELDLDLMNQAAKILTLYDDFESFSKLHTNVNNFRCNIMEASWFERGELLIFKVKANRFLRGMVRALVGTMLNVGKGKTSLKEFEEIILLKNRKYAGAQAPAAGLFLIEVGYPDSILHGNESGQ
jgi:tRNA pseudouridine38-40 synthase